MMTRLFRITLILLVGLWVRGQDVWAGAPATQPVHADTAQQAKVPSTQPVKDWPEPDQVVRLWPGDAPGLVSPVAQEVIENQRIVNVSVPELWVYLPKIQKANRAAIVISPGGGGHHLAMGTHVGNAIKVYHAQDVVVFGLKYRTRYGKNNVMQDAAADCRRALRIIRLRAAEWGIDPARIGIQGYSAGSAVCLGVLGSYDDGDPSASDAAEKMSSRPDFIAMMCLWPGLGKSEHCPIHANPPPVFMAAAEDDTTAPIAYTHEIAEKIKAQGGQVQLFVVPSGGHGAFDLGHSKGPGAKWPDELLPMIVKGK